MAYIFGSIWDRFNRNALNALSKSVEQQGKSIQDLVAEGQLTETQYGRLITVIHGMIKSGDVDKFDLSKELRQEVDKISDKINKGQVSVDDIDKNKGKLDQTFMADSLLQMIAGNAPVNATPADGSITKEKLDENLIRNYFSSPLKNMVEDNSLWINSNSNYSIQGEEIVFTALSGNGRVNYPLDYQDNDLIYRSAFVKANSNFVGIGSGIQKMEYHSGNGQYERISDQRVWPANKFVGIIDGRTSGWDEIRAKKVVAINLTEVFGVGNEPTKEEMDSILNYYDGYIDDKVDIWNYSKMINENLREINSKAITNLINNGNFKTNVMSWQAISSQNTISNGKLINTGTGAARLPRTVLTNIKNVNQGHKYYVYVKIKPTNSDVDLIYVESYAGTTPLGQYGKIFSPQPNVTQNFSGIIESGNQTGNIDLRIFHRYPTNALSNGKSIEVESVNLIDLTNDFGEGNEPTKEEMDKYIENQDGYIDGSTSMLNPQYLFKRSLSMPSNDYFYEPSARDDYDGSGVSGINSETITTSELYGLWDDLINKYPNQLSKSNLGKDESGIHNIYRINFKPMKPKKKILITANIHGNGADGDPQDASITLYEFIKDILESNIESAALSYMRYNVEFEMLPCANPWGYDNNTRGNSNGVDLNRDYHTETPQKETIIYKEWITENNDAVLYLDIHAYGIGTTTGRLAAYGVPGESQENDILYEVGEFIQDNSPFTFELHNISILAGIYYAKNTHNIPSILVEFPVYFMDMKTHGSEMMTLYLKWVGNVLYRYIETQSVNDHIILNSSDGSKRYKLTIDNAGNLTTDEMS